MSSVEFDSIQALIEERIRERRARGDYPVGLEAQLEAEFDAILRSVQRQELDTSDLRGRVSTVGQRVAALNAHPPLTSRVPGGTAMHSTAARVVRRHTGPLTESVRDLGRGVEEALIEVIRLLDAQRSADERQLVEVVGNVFDRLAVLDSVVEAVADLERRMTEVERTTTER